MKAIGLVVVMLGLVGCATQPKPAEESWYRTMAINETMSAGCYAAGYMDADTSATGIFLVGEYRKATYHDPAKLTFMTNDAKQAITIKEEDCRKFSRMIKTAKMEHDSKRQKANSLPSTPSGVRTTNCSTYFGQTHCTSF